MKTHILKLSEQYLNEVIQIRRHLHQYPELSFQEYQTSEFIKKNLSHWNIPFQSIAGTGIVAYIGNTNSKKCIAIRADIDALPIQEKNNCTYTSKKTNVMHACGHDVHTAAALGSIKILKKLENQINGCIKVLFQPGEEVLPGGATMMIKEKALIQPKVNAIIAQHVFPDIDAGKIGFKSGPYMASTDEIYIHLTGKGGHAALPHKNKNPIPIAAQLIHQISQDYSIEKMISENVILSFGKIIANGATNVIPETVEIAGTMRTLNQKQREKIYQYLHNITKKLSSAHKIKIELKIIKGYPPLNNDHHLTKFFQSKAENLLGKKNIVKLPVRMTADDFAYYLQKIPGTYYRLGTGNKKKGIVHNVHTPYFDIDETALFYGMATLSWFTINYLNEYKTP